MTSKEKTGGFVKFPFSQFVLAVAVLVSSKAFAAEATVLNWTVGGQTRSATVFAPPTSGGAAKHPLIFCFHGHGGNMNGASRSGLHDLWPEAVVVYPQGLPTKSPRDTQGLRPGWQMGSGQEGDRDLKFFDAMVADLKTRYGVDGSRIYTTGFSNGAVFSYLLWAKRGNLLAAVAPVAGALSQSESLTVARPAIIIGGEHDKVLPFSEQQRSMEAARAVDAPSKTPLVIRTHPGGHVFPPWAGRAIIEFFKAHSL
jgi:polyhydroxybutyrate depolymerase